MKYRIITLTLLLAALWGCETFSGKSVTETVNIENTYSELYVSDAINVVISVTAEEVKVTTGEHLLPNVIIEEKDDVLDIRLKDGTYFFNSAVYVELPANPGLTKLSLSDASDIEGEINAEKLSIHLANASDAQLTGHVGELTLNLKNASSIKKNIIGQRYGLSCDNCDVALEDASNAYIHCDGTIRVIELSGASDLHYTGNAEIILTGGTPPSSSDIKHDVL